MVSFIEKRKGDVRGGGVQGRCCLWQRAALCADECGDLKGANFSALEKSSGGRLGVALIDTADNT
ncbi:hypothetical protein [Enterobacter kobei]|uniref:hypothetical protein n=1 Tax=Enterobacter kobei TaxID=208224 RepID=UPI003D79CDC4